MKIMSFVDVHIICFKHAAHLVGRVRRTGDLKCFSSQVPDIIYFLVLDTCNDFDLKSQI